MTDQTPVDKTDEILVAKTPVKTSAKIISLDVGGVLFRTTQTTLIKAGFFNVFFARWEELNYNETHFIDRDGEGFKHVLNFLRDPNYKVPKEYIYELDFYDVKYDKYDIRKNMKPKNDLSTYVSSIDDTLKAIFKSFTNRNGNICLSISDGPYRTCHNINTRYVRRNSYYNCR